MILICTIVHFAMNLFLIAWNFRELKFRIQCWPLGRVTMLVLGWLLIAWIALLVDKRCTIRTKI